MGSFSHSIGLLFTTFIQCCQIGRFSRPIWQFLTTLGWKNEHKASAYNFGYFQFLHFNFFYISAFLAMLCAFHAAVNSFVSNHLHFSKWCACLHCLLHLDFCSNPFTWFKPFNVSLCLNLCGFIKKYFQPQFILQHSPHFLQEMHFLVYNNIRILSNSEKARMQNAITLRLPPIFTIAFFLTFG